MGWHSAFSLCPSVEDGKKTVLASFNCHPDLAYIHLRRKSSLEQTGLWAHLWETIMIANWCRRAQPSPLWAAPFPWQSVLGYMIKLAKHEQRIKPGSSVLPQFLLQLPSWVLSLTSVNVGQWGTRWNVLHPPLSCFCLEYFNIATEGIWNRAKGLVMLGNCHP